MSSRKITGVFAALFISLMAIMPAFAQYYPNSFYVNPGYNNYGYRDYAPYGAYGYNPYYYRHHDHTARNVAIGAGIGAAIGLLASHHGHRYYY